MKKILFLLFIFFSQNCHSLEITTDNNKNNDPPFVCSFYLDGEIVKGDTNKFSDGLKKYNAFFKNKACGIKKIVYLNSEGGDLEESLKLGRFIRKNEIQTNVTNSSKCLSSCVFVLAGGVQRYIDTNQYSTLSNVRIGIHRPYFLDLNSNTSISDITNMRNKMRNIIISYLQEMDINTNLYDDMLSIEPNDMKILSKEELQRYRLSIDDANYDELKVAKNAKFFNIYSSEYRKRKSLIDSQCPSSNIDDYMDCYNKILLDISINEFKKRRDRLNKVCKTSGNELMDENCMRNIMVFNK